MIKSNILDNKKILYICSRKFWPAKSGHEVKMYNYCRGLHDKLGYTVDLFIFDESESNTSKPSFINNVIFAKNISLFQKAKNILFNSIISKEKAPFQCSLFYCHENSRLIQKTVENNKYAAVIVDMIRLAPYHESLCTSNALKILEMDDLLSKRYERQLQSVNSKSQIQGYYNPSLVVKCLLKLKFIKKLILSSERKRLVKAEEKYIGLYDKTTLVSNIEAKELNIKYKTDKCFHLGMGTEYIASSYIIEKPEDNSAVFIGNMAYAANADSIRFIAKEVLPKCKNINKFTVIGFCPEEIKKEFSSYSNIYFTGIVDDLIMEVSKCRLVLAPIVYGSGIKTKILDAMAIGTPVITNSIGAEGISCTNNVNIIIADTPDEIARKADFLMQDTNYCQLLSKNAHELIKEYYDWGTVFIELKKLLSE